MPTPPFAGLADFAQALRDEVPDSKAQQSDEAFIAAGLARYAEKFPGWETADIGDGTEHEWQLGVAPFETASTGFADLLGMTVELLEDGDEPCRPPSMLTDREHYWLDQRSVGGKPATVLTFLETPTRVRVRWRKRWTLANVPADHHMAVVYRAAADKCRHLVSVYSASVDPTAAGTELFAGAEAASNYREQITRYMREFESILGIGPEDAGGAAPRFTTGTVKTGHRRVFRRGYLR